MNVSWPLQGCGHEITFGTRPMRLSRPTITSVVFAIKNQCHARFGIAHMSGNRTTRRSVVRACRIPVAYPDSICQSHALDAVGKSVSDI